jgi:hypothetical protein
MSEISKFTVFPYGSYLKFRNDSGKTANVFDPKNNLPKIRKPPTLRIAEKTSLDRKITELKNSSQDLQRLNNFFSDMSKNIYEKADLSAMQFRKFLETSQGDDLINKVTEEAFLQEDRKIKDMIRVFDDSNDSGNSKFSDQSGLLKSWSPIRTFDDEEDFEEEISDEAIQRMAFEDRIINSINLVNHLGELGFNKLAGKLIKKIDNNIDSLNEKYPSISPPRLGLATMALENSNDDAPDAELKEFLNKSIDKTQFIQADATSIKDFYMSASSKKGYQEEANQALMQAIVAQHEDPSQTNTVNVYVLDKLFAYAVENQLIKNPKAFIQNIQAMREGAKLPEDFSNIYSVINQSNPVFEKNDKAKTNLVLALCQIKENLGMEYFRKKDLSKINEKIVLITH